MKKGQIYEGIIERVDFPNKGIVFVPEEEQYVTVKNGIPGQKIRFMINKFKRGNAEGRLLEVLEKSPLETREPVCSIFPACGGCMYQTMPYEEQVKMKEGQIRRIMDPVVKGEYLFEGVKRSPKEFHYRNKMEFSFGDEFKDGPLSLGLHKKGSTYDVLTAGDCQLVHEDMDKILLCVLNYFKERNVSYYKKMQHVGYLRHLLLRRGDTTGEILVNLVTTTQEEYEVGTLTTIKDNFRVYDSMEDGIKGYFEFIQLPRYSNLKGITDPKTYLETIKADGYATSSTYVDNNMKLINQYDLTQYDKKEGNNSMSYDRTAVVNQTKAWLGYNEADGSHRAIIDLYNTQNPRPRGYKVTYTDAWCATFVSAVAVKLGYTRIIPTECSCSIVLSQCEKYQIFL